MPIEWSAFCVWALIHVPAYCTSCTIKWYDNSWCNRALNFPILLELLFQTSFFLVVSWKKSDPCQKLSLLFFHHDESKKTNWNVQYTVTRGDLSRGVIWDVLVLLFERQAKPLTWYLVQTSSTPIANTYFIGWLVAPLQGSDIFPENPGMEIYRIKTFANSVCYNWATVNKTLQPK